MMSSRPRLTSAAVALLVGLFASGAFAQDRDRERELREKIEKALQSELQKLREELVEIVKSELASGSSGSSPATPSVPAAGGVEKALGLITPDLLKKHATYLASDELEGRNTGYPGNDKAAEYIADVMKKAGLKPVGDEDGAGAKTYFQHFNVGRRRTRNCLGLLEGTDPDLKKELVVIGAHHDHVGTEDQGHWGRFPRPRSSDDTIWNGADDNASGTSTVLSLIRAFGEGGLRTKRSILFMTFSGEEGGLLGSKYYCDHPIAPIEQHVFMLNLDMVGRNGDKEVGIHGVGSAQDGIVRRAVEDAVQKAGLKAVIHDRVAFMGGDSDHSSFSNRRVPFTFIFTGLHADYHKVSDHADKLDYDNMAKIGKTALHVLQAVGDGEASPRFQSFNFRDAQPTRARRTLGVTVDENLGEDEFEALGLGDEEGAIRVESVTDGSTAHKAGVKVGDYILSIGDTKFGRDEPLKDLRKALLGVKPKEKVPVAIIRGAKRTTLEATWDK